MTAGNHEITVQNKNSLEQAHISKTQFWNWQAGRLASTEEERFLGHIGTCTYCAGQFGNWMEEGCTGMEDFMNLALEPEDSVSMPPFLLSKSQDSMEDAQKTEGARRKNVSLLSEPPAYLKEEILRRTRQMDVQAAIHIRETSRRVQFWLYSLKVGLAVMASIFLLMVTANVQNMDFDTHRTDQVQRQDISKEVSITDTLKQKSGEISNILNNLSNGLFRIDTKETNQEESQEGIR